MVVVAVRSVVLVQRTLIMSIIALPLKEENTYSLMLEEENMEKCSKGSLFVLLSLHRRP